MKNNRENRIGWGKVCRWAGIWIRLSLFTLFILTEPLVVEAAGQSVTLRLENVSLKEAFKYSISKQVIIEEFKSGEELSVDIYVEGTKAKLLSVTASKKIKENEKSFTIIQSYYPAPVNYDENKVLEITQKIVDVFKLKDTPLLVQMIVNEDEYNVLEFSARMGGGSKYKLIDDTF